MDISVSLVGTATLRAEFQRIGRQAAFALSRTLNDTANAAQAAVQDSLASRFTLRRDRFVRNTIYRRRGVDFATKAKQSAAIVVDPSRDFLAQHEEGGRKAPIAGKHLAVPLQGVQPNRAVIVPKRLRPGALKADPKVQKVTTPAGTFLVRQKRGNKRLGLGTRTEFLYKLQATVPLRPRLDMRETSLREIDRSFVRLALVNIDKALRTAR